MKRLKQFVVTVSVVVFLAVAGLAAVFSDDEPKPSIPIAPPSTVKKYYPCDDTSAASTHVADQITINTPRIGPMVLKEQQSRIRVSPGNFQLQGKLYVCGKGSKLLLPKQSLGRDSEIYMGEGTIPLADGFNPVDLWFYDIFFEERMEEGVNTFRCSQAITVGPYSCEGLFGP